MIQATIQSSFPTKSIKPSDRYQVRIGGQPVFVYQCQGAGYAVLSAEGTIVIEIETSDAFQQAIVRPLRHGIVPEKAADNVLRFEVEAPAKLSVEFDGDIREPLFIWINPPETAERPDPTDKGVHYYKGGEVHLAGEIRLQDGETLYIEEGAVVHGRVTADGASNITVRGRGILDGSLWRENEEAKKHAMLLPARCSGVTIEGISVVDGPTWHLVPTACSNVRIENVNVLTFAGTGDGIDIVGCEDVTIENVFVRSKDDCIAIKAVDYFHEAGCRDVRRVRVSRSVFFNAEWGNALEIGYETSCETISDIEFSDCDIIHCQFEGYESGGTFTIHNGDSAVVENVLYSNIRIEDSEEKLVDIKIQFSQYSRDTERGQVRNIRFENIVITGGLLPVSIIRGYDGAHMIDGVTFSGISYLGEPLRSANAAKMVVELSRNVKFEQ
ncbi:glycosyl hydrolase family 28 protein [Paenibacillus sp. OV219]|uniref:glycosyl hydrolase family 28 protein n=1 Tax=Paenibacillus sp. OV219 TaxID=1884377 RepID=UPI0008CDB7FE|nr:glycosyl hydrolase family 28 protein [Paenibacillus sp. OV219]SEO74414.1 Glycosyl hydrolases family 28 [Paenibacillus sp. OV219]